MNEPTTPAPRPGPRPPDLRPEPTPAPGEPEGFPRRWFLAGAAAVLAAGGAGVAAERLGFGTSSPPPLPPPALVSTADVERALLADLDATTGGTGEVRALIAAARADHEAHLAALTAVLSAYQSRSSTRSPSARGLPRTRAQLQVAEQRACSAAADGAQTLTGAHAALLASIAACEASHAALMR